jgi:hypothetical protein
MAVDIAIAAQSIPSFTVVRRMRLAEVDDVRRQSSLRIGWTALFVRAYGQVCSAIPELRDLYVRWPAPYVYRHPEPVAGITVHRQDEHLTERLIWGRIAAPNQHSPEQVQQAIERFATAPIQDVFRDGLRLERRPALVRRLTWWTLTQWSGRKRAKHIGTFTISSLGNIGAHNAHHPLVTTSSLALGPVGRDGCCDVALICDHRAIDGMLAARALQQLETTLIQNADADWLSRDAKRLHRAG